MSTVGMSQDEQFQLLSVVATVLHLGNIKLERKSDGNAQILPNQRPGIFTG